MRAVVSGQVQGVGFRYYILAKAQSFGLTGNVRNLPGGYAVEVVARGERERLEALVECLQHGPPGARVDEVTVDWSAEPDPRHRSFTIER